MTAKRFNYIPFDGFNDNGKELSAYEVLEILNDLHEENMMLKGEVAHYKLILMSLEKEAKRISQIHCLGE